MAKKVKAAAVAAKPRSAGKPDIELGRRIRLRRVEIKISQSELPDSVSFQQVQKYEKGVNRVVPRAGSKSPPRSECL